MMNIAHKALVQCRTEVLPYTDSTTSTLPTLAKKRSVYDQWIKREVVLLTDYKGSRGLEYKKVNSLLSDCQ